MDPVPVQLKWFKILWYLLLAEITGSHGTSISVEACQPLPTAQQASIRATTKLNLSVGVNEVRHAKSNKILPLLQRERERERVERLDRHVDR